MHFALHQNEANAFVQAFGPPRASVPAHTRVELRYGTGMGRGNLSEDMEELAEECAAATSKARRELNNPPFSVLRYSDGKLSVEAVDFTADISEARFSRYLTQKGGGYFDIEGAEKAIQGKEAALAKAAEIHG